MEAGGAGGFHQDNRAGNREGGEVKSAQGSGTDRLWGQREGGMRTTAGFLDSNQGDGRALPGAGTRTESRLEGPSPMWRAVCERRYVRAQCTHMLQ